MHGSALVATSIALLGLGYASLRTARAVAGPWRLPTFGVTSVALGLFVSTLLTVVALVGRAAGAFDAGLWAAAVVGVVWSAAAHRWPSTVQVTSEPALKRRFAFALVAMLAVYGYVSLQYQMHDEHAVYGHKSMVEQFRRGIYPLYYPSQPGEEARYHYGFDIIAGALARAYGLHSDHAIDLVTMLMVLFMCFGAAAVAYDAGAKRSAPLAALAIHLGAGLGWIVLAGVEGRHPRCMAQYHHPTCNVELFPTQFLNIFQHPVAVGVPLFVLMVLLLPRLVRRPEGISSRYYLGLALSALVLLAGASVGQFVYFALGALAALAASPVWAWGEGKAGLRGVAVLLAVCAASLGLAYAMGGMLAYNPSIDPGLVVQRPELGFPKETEGLGILYHHVVNLGLGFVLVPLFVVVVLARRGAAASMLLAFAIGGMLVAHIFIYTRSWDIVKFPSAASFALSLLYVVVVDRFLSARAAFAWLRRAGAALVIGGGVVSATFVVWPLPRATRLYDPGRWLVDPLIEQTIDWWRDHDYRSEHVIYAQSNVAQQLSVFGGLSVVAQDADLYYMGVKMEVLHRLRRDAARVRGSMDPKALDALGVAYVMFSDAELGNLGPKAREALEDPARFEVVATFPGARPSARRRIWRVVDQPSG